MTKEKTDINNSTELDEEIERVNKARLDKMEAQLDKILDKLAGAEGEDADNIKQLMKQKGSGSSIEDIEKKAETERLLAENEQNEWRQAHHDLTLESRLRDLFLDFGGNDRQWKTAKSLINNPELQNIFEIEDDKLVVQDRFTNERVIDGDGNILQPNELMKQTLVKNSFLIRPSFDKKYLQTGTREYWNDKKAALDKVAKDKGYQSKEWTAAREEYIDELNAELEKQDNLRKATSAASPTSKRVAEMRKAGASGQEIANVIGLNKGV